MTHRANPSAPPPESRVPVGLYLDLRSWLIANDPDAEPLRVWAEGRIGPPEDADAMAWEIVWIVLCAGRTAQSARTIERKVRAALLDGRPVLEAFGHRGKAAAIERAWAEREDDFAALQGVLATRDVERLVDWCGSLPFVGDDTKFQLAKNFGVDCAKPDIWLSRLAGFPDRPRKPVGVRFPACMALCRPLAEAAGDRIATVDTLLWLACNKGVLKVDPAAGPVRFAPREVTAKPVWS